MEPNTTTYQSMYEGLAVVVDPDYPDMPAVTVHDSTYYDGQIGFTITQTHKLAQDKPTLRIAIPWETWGVDEPSPHTRMAIADFCLREFAKYVDELNEELYNRARPDYENGKYEIHRPGGEVLLRNTACFAVCPMRDYDYGGGVTLCLLPQDQRPQPKLCLCLLIQVQLPRRKLRRVIQMLCRDLPDAVWRFVAELDTARLMQVAKLAEQQKAIRDFLKDSPYCAFIANGSILPRAKGSDLPMIKAVPFVSVPCDEIEICGVRGMGLRRGVTVITGGGYSGKSTLLDAISAGIYDHVLGDGRELCITDATAMAISAEDGRSVRCVNISPFIKWLPGGDAKNFSTDCASGSTSQAANIMEAVDSGAKLLLIDEDKSATNFMIRDDLMKALIRSEPITPFTDRVGELAKTQGVSTILVIGGSGAYLSVADRIYIMEDYRIHDITASAKSACKSGGLATETPPLALWSQNRTLRAEGFTSYPEGSGSERLEVWDMGFILIGDERIDVRGLHGVVSARQLDALGFVLRSLEVANRDAQVDIKRKIDELYAHIYKEGLDGLYSGYFTTCNRFLDLPRPQEVLCLVNRMRKAVFITDERRG